MPHSNRPGRARTSGLSLPELAIAILIAALVIGTATPAFLGLIETRRNETAIRELTEWQRQIDRFQRRNLRYPDSLTDIGEGPLNDPWGTPYIYVNLRAPDATAPRTDLNLVPLNHGYDLYSRGSDGVSLGPVTAAESRDDILRARNGDYIGLASDYR